MYKLTYFNKPRDFLKNQKKEEKKTNTIDPEDSIQSSVRRSRAMIFDYAKCNNFDMFVTFTFNPKKVNRYDLNVCFTKMQSWLWRQQRKHDNQLKYIIVPERHKDGAIHFHALFEGYTGALKKTKVIQNSNRVYNLPTFRFGFTNMQYLDDDPQKATAYLCKYITKEMEMVHGRRRYWASKNLRKPLKMYNKMHDLNLWPDLQNQVFVNDALAIYEIPKTVKQMFD